MDPARNQAIAGQRAVLNRDQYVALLRAKETSMTSSDWRPISEAPKDGTKILLWVPDNVCTPMQHVGWWDGSMWKANLCGSWFNPTHWQPLPPPPVEDK